MKHDPRCKPKDVDLVLHCALCGAVEHPNPRPQDVIDSLKAEVVRLSDNLYGFINRTLEAIRQRRWLCEGRGSYRYDDDEYRKEAGYAFDEIQKIALEARDALGKEKV